jgi:hypothetical protein
VLLPKIVFSIASNVKFNETKDFSNVIRKNDAAMDVSKKSRVYKPFA